MFDAPKVTYDVLNIVTIMLPYIIEIFLVLYGISPEQVGLLVQCFREIINVASN